MTETLSPTLPEDVERLAQRVARRASRRGVKLVTAESCTAGLLASLITDVEGCAHVFDRGFVTYSDAAKRQMLGVPQALLNACGAVSAAAARAMAEGALAASDGDLALAVTGFAGTGEPGDEPGLVHFAVARRDGQTRALEKHFGDIGRGPVRIGCLRTGLEMLQRAIG
ncbi:MAG TPA: nicotinamide-nucleotide amidohydrolase family protein [Caulobacteraceae bacterium]|nr:nicotinamide-nucleotide amidohydrolase family protein [Caulobacteraceae bacterium]